MITLTKNVDPYLKWILNTQENNFFVEIQNFMASFVEFLLLAIISVIFLLLAIVVIFKIAKYWKADVLHSLEIQHGLQVNEGLDSKTIETKTNKIVKRATVRFNTNKVIIKVPTKLWYEGFDDIGCRHELRRRLNSFEFKEFLSTHYHGYRFGDPLLKRDYYLLVGEVY